MNLLGGINYDPTTAVAKAASSLLAMTAFDTTNLRLTVNAPASGKILCKMRCSLVFSANTARILFGVLSGASVVGRQAVMQLQPATGGVAEAEFLITGLTPGASYTLDAAYSVEVVLASATLNYGGPDDTTTNNAWGGFEYELWDPQPLQISSVALQIDSSGRVDVGKWLGTAVSTPTTAGVPNVNAKTWNDLATVALPLIPTVAGRTLDCSAGGEAGVDWANVGSPTTVQGLSGTTIKNSTDNATTEAAIKAKTDSLTFTVANQVDSNVIDWKGATAPAMTGDAFARLGAPAGASVSADIAAVKAQTSSIQTDTTAIISSIAAIPTAVWAFGTRTLSSFGTLVADIWAAVLETGFSASRLLRGIAGAAGGKSSGGGTTFRNASDTADAISGTVSAARDRTSSTWGT